MNSCLLLLFLSALPLFQEIEEPGSKVASDERVAVAAITGRSDEKIPVRMQAGGGYHFSSRKAVYGKGSRAIEWEVTPDLLFQRCEIIPEALPDGSVVSVLYVPYGIEFKEFTVRQVCALNNTVSKAKVDVIVEGARPPPKPDDDKITPDPPTPKVKNLRLVVIEDELNRSPRTSQILQDRTFWDGLGSQGHGWYRVALNSESPSDKKYLDRAREYNRGAVSTGSAYLVIEELKGGGFISISTLPTVEEIKLQIKGLTQ